MFEGLGEITWILHVGLDSNSIKYKHFSYHGVNFAFLLMPISQVLGFGENWSMGWRQLCLPMKLATQENIGPGAWRSHSNRWRSYYHCSVITIAHCVTLFLTETCLCFLTCYDFDVVDSQKSWSWLIDFRAGLMRNTTFRNGYQRTNCLISLNRGRVHLEIKFEFVTN